MRPDEELPDVAQRHVLVPATFEVRAVETDDDGNPVRADVGGYGQVWGEIADINGFFFETFERDAFDESIAEDTDRFRVLYQHVPAWLLGRPTVRVDDIGLRWDAKLTVDTTWGRDSYALLRDEVLTDVSIGFDPVEEDVEFLADGTPFFRVKKARLWEFSLVTWGAYRKPKAALRAVGARRWQRISTALQKNPQDRSADEPTPGDPEPEPARSLLEGLLDPAERAALVERCKGPEAANELVQTREALDEVLAAISTNDDSDRSVDRTRELALREAELRLGMRRSA